MEAATARQTSTSRPVQLPLSSGAEKPGRPWLTPQDTMPLSLTVLSVCAVAACVARPAARARVKNSHTRIMAYPFKGRPGTEAPAPMGHPDNPTSANASLDSQFDAQSGQAMDRRSRQAPQRAATE